MRILALVCGPTEAMNAGYVLRRLYPASKTHIETVCCVYGRKVSVPSKLREETLEGCGLFYPWSRITDLCDLSDGMATTPAEERAAAAVAVRSALGFDKVSAILTHSPDKLPERAILEAFPEAAIIFYDNGLASHLPRDIVPDAWQQIYTISPRDLERIEQAWFMLGDLLPVPSPFSSRRCIAIDAGDYRAHLESLLVESEPFFPRVNATGPTELVLGTSFYRTGRISWEQERAIYSERARTILEGSDHTVIYKEHPRASSAPLLDGSNRVQPVDSTMPVEFLPLQFEIRSTSSIGSTAQLTLKKIFDIPSEMLGQGIPTRTLAPVRLLGQALTNT